MNHDALLAAGWLAVIMIAILFAVFEVQGWRVPDALAILLSAVVGAVIVIALSVAVLDVIQPQHPGRRRHE
jgi:uncharacterized integral membrane protein